MFTAVVRDLTSQWHWEEREQEYIMPVSYTHLDVYKRQVTGCMFFVLVLFAALTSSIALTESAVSTFEDEFKWSRKKATTVIGVIIIALGSLSALGYGPLANVTIIGMQFLDFFDFLTNTIMMPLAAIATCLFISKVVGLERIEDEVTLCDGKFRLSLIHI